MAVMPKTDSFLEALKLSKVGAEISAEIDAQKAADRREIADALEKLHAEIEVDYPKANAACEKAAAEVKKLEQQLLAARLKHSQAFGARSSMSSRYANARLDLERQLSDSASPLIVTAREWVRDEQARVRKMLRTSYATEKNVITGAARDVCMTNAPRVNARIAGLNRMFDALAELALAPDQAGVHAIIERMKAALPKIED